MSGHILTQFQSIVGKTHVLSSGDLSAYERDWRGRMQGKALCVVKPSSTEEVALVVKACAAAGVAIVPQGGNTGLAGGATPDASGSQAVLSVARLNRVRALDPHNNTITVEAGVILADVQARARERLEELYARL